MRFWPRKKKPDDATSGATSDTAPDLPVENDSNDSETSPEIAAGETTDRQTPEGEPEASQTDTPSEDELGTGANSHSETNGDGGESSTEKDEPSALQTDSLAEVTQGLSELRQLFEEQIAQNRDQNNRFDALYREMQEYLEAFHKPVGPCLTLRVETPSKIDVVEATDPSTPEGDPPALQTDSLTEVTQSLSELRQLFEGQIARNANQNKMFDAIHREMKEYKENSLLEAYQKPIIQNLIGLYDNFKLIESQLNGILNETEDIRSNDLSQFQKNLENVRLELEEVLFRLDVIPYEERLETLNRKLHKTLDTKPADTPEQDWKVAEVHKIGFYWRDKVFRPEEVTIFRYTPSPTEKGEERDG